MKTMHIALVTETYPPEINGVAMTLGRLVNGLRQAGHQVALVRPRQAHDPHQEVVDETLVTGLSIPGYAGLNIGLASKRRLLDLWQKTQPDIVHIATEGPLGWSALGAAKTLRIPTVAGFHTNFHNYTRHYGVGWLRGAINVYLRHFHNRASMTLAPTPGLCEHLHNDRFRNVRVMTRGVDTTLFNPSWRDVALRAAWGVEADTPVALYVGRIAPEKNLDLLATAFRAMQQRLPDSRLVIVGDGPELRRMQRNHPDFIFAGPRVGKELAHHYASADCFLFPSLTETFGNVLLEAMASGLATVAFDYAAAAEHVRNGENGIKVPYGDSANFVSRAVELTGDLTRMKALGMAAHTAAQTLGWDAVLAQLGEHYRALLADRVV